MNEHPLGVRPAPLGSLHFQNEMEHWLLGPNIDTWQPTGILPAADTYFAVERDADGTPTDLRPLDSAGIRRTRDGWIDSTEEQGTTKQGETD